MPQKNLERRAALRIAPSKSPGRKPAIPPGIAFPCPDTSKERSPCGLKTPCFPVSPILPRGGFRAKMRGFNGKIRPTGRGPPPSLCILKAWFHTNPGARAIAAQAPQARAPHDEKRPYAELSERRAKHPLSVGAVELKAENPTNAANGEIPPSSAGQNGFARQIPPIPDAMRAPFQMGQKKRPRNFPEPL